MITSILASSLILIAGIAKGASDAIQFHFSNSFAKNWNAHFWNPAESWKNKYKNNDPSQGEKFFGSTTIFVTFTDAWHTLQFFQDIAISALAIFCLPLNFFIAFIVARIIFQIGFWITFK